MLSFIAYVIAVVCFGLQWGEFVDDAEHLITAGLFFVAVGLALTALPQRGQPWSPFPPRRDL